MNITK